MYKFWKQFSENSLTFHHLRLSTFIAQILVRNCMQSKATIADLLSRGARNVKLLKNPATPVLTTILFNEHLAHWPKCWYIAASVYSCKCSHTAQIRTNEKKSCSYRLHCPIFTSTNIWPINPNVGTKPSTVYSFTS